MSAYGYIIRTVVVICMQTYFAIRQVKDPGVLHSKDSKVVSFGRGECGQLGTGDNCGRYLQYLLAI